MKLTKTTLSFLILSLIGLVDAGYLTYRHFVDRYAPCTTGGCEVVLTSQYSEIFGIPTSAFGAAYYATVIAAVVAYLILKNKKIIDYLAYFTAVGFVTSIFLVYIMLGILDSVCLYCLVSAATSTLLFVTGVIHIRKQNA